MSIHCSSKKFETFGLLCSHSLKVFEANDVKVVPKKYILMIKRWTRESIDESIEAESKKIKELCLRVQNIDKHNDNAPTLVVNDGIQPKGFKC